MKNLIAKHPRKRISPIDGMAVTAQVWEEAHDYHLQRERLHAALLHGSGVVWGLEVIASDPADSSVYVLPGIAIDTHGQSIVLPEPVAYDLGRAQGLLYLLLTFEESHPRTDPDQDEGPLYIHAQFGLAATSALPDTPYVELARIRRKGRDTPIIDAQDPVHPQENEIDQRFRREVGTASEDVVSVAVCYAGGASSRRHGRGASNLARELRQAGQRVWVDDDTPMAPGLEDYTFVYLVGQDAFQLSRDEMNALYAFVQAGGTILIESCRYETENGDPPADAAFADLLASMGISLEEIAADHPLLHAAHLFPSPPAGFETEGTPQFLVGEGVIFSTHDYGCLWQGERRGAAASREEIRAAMEWGNNIVAYVVARRREAQAGSGGE
jgi:hypothetical protein